MVKKGRIQRKSKRTLILKQYAYITYVGNLYMTKGIMLF